METPGIEPATPGLQGIAFIHYTTGVSLLNFLGRYRGPDKLSVQLGIYPTRFLSPRFFKKASGILQSPPSVRATDIDLGAFLVVWR